jgi:hypothetical protein
MKIAIVNQLRFRSEAGLVLLILDDESAVRKSLKDTSNNDDFIVGDLVAVT